jgi:hypothetical protein
VRENTRVFLRQQRGRFKKDNNLVARIALPAARKKQEPHCNYIHTARKEQKARGGLVCAAECEISVPGFYI